MIEKKRYSNPIEVLCVYHDILKEQGLLVPEEFTDENINYIAVLNAKGELTDIIDHQHQETRMIGKKEKIVTVPTKERLPKRVQEKDKPYALDHRTKYVFGLKLNKNELLATKTELEAFNIMAEHNLAIIKGIESPVVNAYRKFLETWNPEENTENPLLLALGKDFDKAKVIFALDTDLNNYLHNEPKMIDKWLEYYHKQKVPSLYEAQDAITGKANQPMTRTHEKIKGLPGGLGQGNLLVAFKYDGYESFNHENQNKKSESYNANIGYQTMQKYTKALNYILEKRQFIVLDNLVLIPIVLTQNTNTTNDLIAWLKNDSDTNNEELKHYITKRLQQAKSGQISNEELIDLNRYDTDVYLLGLEANSARVMIKLFEHQSFGKIIENIANLQTDIQVKKDKPRIYPLYQIAKQTLPSYSDKNADTIVVRQLLASIIRNNTIPDNIFNQIMRRIKIEPKNLNDIKYGMIQKYIHDINKTQRKDTTFMEVNTPETTPAYLYGRMFAIIERIQNAALGDLNRNVKDQYFASVLTKPTRTFPRLIANAQKHLKKIENEGYSIHLNKLLTETIAQLDTTGFADHLSNKEQGLFIIGYYQQRQKFFAKKDKSKE